MSTLLKALLLSLRSLSREWHAGELRIVAAAVVVAVTSMTAVGFFTDRAERAMLMQAAELLAADLVMHSTRPFTPATTALVERHGIRSTQMLSFRSVIVVRDSLELTEVKAVTAGYPLYGSVRLSDIPYGDDKVTDQIPLPGEVWLEARLMSKLDLEVGDEVELGELRLSVEAVISYEPDRGGDMFNIAPRLMMNMADIEASGLVQPGSRVTHALLLAGSAAEIGDFRDATENNLDEDQHFHDAKEGRPELQTALKRAQQFLGLAAVVAVLLAGAAIAVSCRHYVDRRLNTAALLRCLGASDRFISNLFALQVLLIGLTASLIGCALGYLAQTVLVEVFRELLVGELPAPSLQPIATGLLTGVVALAGFALPPILRLKDVSPARVIRRELGGLPPRAVTAYGFALLSLTALVLWQSGDTRLAGYVIGAAVITLVLLSVFAILFVNTLRRLRGRVGVAWRFGLANLSRRADGSVLQIVGFGLGFTMLLLLTIVRGDILDEWRRNLPPDAPNYFLVNVQPTDVSTLRAFLEQRGLDTVALYPMVRGRLQSIAGRDMSNLQYDDPRAQRLANREFNLSFTAELGPGNLITVGDWWPPGETNPQQFSVEEGLAETLGIELNDELVFNITGSPVTATVTSLRAVEWDSFDVNFFVVSPPELLSNYPATYISSFHLPAGDRETLTELVRAFPSITILDVDALLTKVRQIMEQAVVGVEYVFLFTLVAGVVVLLAAVQSTMDERRFETAIIRALGGPRRLILRGLIAEFVILGVVAGLLAALISSAVGVVVAHEIFQLRYTVNPVLWLLGLVAGGLCTGIAGVLSARSAVEQSPLHTLRTL